MKLLAVSGSVRDTSHNSRLLREAAELLAPEVEVELYDGLKAVPPYDEDDDVGDGPAGAAHFPPRSRAPMPCCSRRPSTTRPSPDS
jgi:chromate reductase